MPPKQSAKEAKKLAKLREDLIKRSDGLVEQGEEHIDKLRDDKPYTYNKPFLTKGLDFFDQAIDTFTENAKAYLRKANCHKGMAEGTHDTPQGGKEWHTAIDNYCESEKYLKADEVSPALQSLLPEVYSNRAYCYEQIGKWDDAIADYSNVIEIQPGDDHAYNMRGQARGRKRIPGMKLKQVEFKMVIEDFTRAIELNENNYYAYANRGSAFFDNHEYRKAIEDYSRAMYVKDDYTYMLYRRAVAYFECVLHERLHAGTPAAAPTTSDAAKGNKTQEEIWEEEFWQEERAQRAKELQDDFLQQALLDLATYIKKQKELSELSEAYLAMQLKVQIHLEIGTEEHFELALTDLTEVRQHHEKNPKECKDLKEWELAKRQVIREKRAGKQQGAAPTTQEP